MRAINLSPAGRRGVIAFLVGVIVLVGALAFDHWWLQNDEGAPVGLSIGGPFTLTDQNGTARRDGDFRGKLMLVYFGYTYCPDACPTALSDMSRALDLLGGKAKSVQPIFITVDPARDTPAVLKQYAANFHPGLIALTGSPDAIAAAARGYRVYYKKADQNGEDYLVDHSSYIYLMGRDGKYLTHFPPGVSADSMAAAIQRHL
jgi:protein SCO1